MTTMTEAQWTSVSRGGAPATSRASTACIWVIVVAYNGEPWLDACLDSLVASEHPVDILVVDNASTDGTPAVVGRFRHVRYLRLQSNVGFGRGNNVGIACALEAGADYVFLLNQDAIVMPQTIGRLLEVMSARPEYGLLSPLHFGADGALDPSFLSNYLSRHASALVSDMFHSCAAEVYPVGAVNAAAWLVSRDCLSRVGGFDPLFFMYGEDDDYCRRVAFHGLLCGVTPLARVTHVRGHHAPKPGASRHIRRRAARIRSELLVQLKTLNGSYAALIYHTVVSQLFTAFERLVNRLDWREFAARLLALSRVVPEFPAVFRHRRQSAERGMHWLSKDGVSAQPLSDSDRSCA